MTEPSISVPSPLRADHDLEPFDCRNPDLNDWLRRRARKNEAVGASRTFVVCKEDVVVGYYCLATGAVTRVSTPRPMSRNMPDPVPVVVMGRLAVDVTVSGSGVGSGLVKDAVRRALLVSESVGVKALLVHAISEDVKRWYMTLGFLESPIEPLTLCLALDSARRATTPAD
ncbi:MAG: GNAT family N-acetyltransferase [Thermomicrobiales bacterium]